MSDEKPNVNAPLYADEIERYTPTGEELAARRKRSMAIALSLAAFMLFVFFTMLSKAGAI